MPCGHAYETHEWASARGLRVCGVCGLVELRSVALRRDVLRALAEAGIRVQGVDGPDPVPP